MRQAATRVVRVHIVVLLLDSLRHRGTRNQGRVTQERVDYLLRLLYASGCLKIHSLRSGTKA